MNEKALILHGNNNIGKTTTLYELIQLFFKEKVYVINKHKVYKNSKRTVPEMSVLIEYKKKVIWIITSGDTLGCVKSEIDKFKEKGYKIEDCDLFICASHNSGNLVKFLLENFKIKKFIAKEDEESDRDVFCKRKAKDLLKEIDNMLMNSI